MNRFIIRVNYEEVFSFLLTLLSVWMSRTVFFGVVYQNTTRIAYCVCIFFACLFIPIGVIRLKRILTAMLVPFTLFMINILWCFTEMNASNLNAVLGYVVMLLCGAMIVVLIRPQLFAKYYIRILSAYCVLSLPCVIIANINENMARAMCQSGYDWRTPYGYNPFYTWGMNGTISVRNSGPFWEPGAFQGYIWIAILLLLFNVDGQSLERRKATFVLFLISLLTTQSTTGYILMLVSFVFFNEKILQLFEIKNLSTKVMIVIFVALIGLVFLSTSTVVINKIGNQENISTQMRTADILTGGLLALKSGPFGLGETETRNSIRESLGLYRDDSAGLIQITYTFGWFMGIYYISSLCGIARRLFMTDAHKEKVGIGILMIILHLTEGLWSLPLFWILMLEYSEKETA